MTPAQINAAIAGWMGWTRIETVGAGDFGIKPDGKTAWDEIPNYHGDLNACHEAVEKLDDDQFERFIDNLQDGIGTMKNVFMATAPQRTEALLRTLNLWKE